MPINLQPGTRFYPIEGLAPEGDSYPTEEEVDRLLSELTQEVALVRGRIIQVLPFDVQAEDDNFDESVTSKRIYRVLIEVPQK